MKLGALVCKLVLALLAVQPGLAQEYIITTVAGGGPEASGHGDGGPATRASLNWPGAAAVDAAGNLYIADTRNAAVRKVTPDGIISTFAGGLSGGYSGDGGPAASAAMGSVLGLAFDLQGNLYVSERSNNIWAQRVRRISRDGIITTFAGGVDCYAGGYGDGKPATGASIFPQGLTSDSSGNLYIASADQVRKVSPNSTISTIAGMVSCGANAEGFSGDGGPALEAKLKWPKGLATDRAGNLYIADFGNNRVRKVDTNGIITTVAGNGQQGSIGFMRSLNAVNGKRATEIGIRPQGVAVDNAGNLFIADPENGCVWIMTRDGRMRIIAGGSGSDAPGDGGPATKGAVIPIALALGKRGTVYVVDETRARVRLLTPTRPPADLDSPDSQKENGGSITSTAAQFEIVAPSPAERNLSPDQLAEKVSNAIDANRKQYHDLVYKWELKADFTGTLKSRFPTFSQPDGEQIQTHTPVLRGHTQMMNHDLVEVTDGWADQPGRWKDLGKRTSTSRLAPSQGEPQMTAIIKELVKPPHTSLIGMALHRGGRAYVIESVPTRDSRTAGSTGAARCASALKATLFIDAATFFPVRLDAEAVSPGMCSSSGIMPLDSTGTRGQIHYVKVSRKDPCGTATREIWVLDEAVERGRITTDGFIATPGQTTQRVFPLGPNYKGGEFKATTTRTDFRLFVTGGCISFGETVESKPVESVQTAIYYDLNDLEIPFHEVGLAPPVTPQREHH